MKPQLSIKNGKRWSTDKLLYENFRNKLFIRTYAHVEKVCLKSVGMLLVYITTVSLKVLMQSNRAIGVQFVRSNKTFKTFAKHGVILSAGAIGTPKILMLSGIGPKDHLQNLKVNFVFLTLIFNIYI